MNSKIENLIKNIERLIDEEYQRKIKAAKEVQEVQNKPYKERTVLDLDRELFLLDKFMQHSRIEQNYKTILHELKQAIL